jgi:hypothetical protein
VLDQCRGHYYRRSIPASEVEEGDCRRGGRMIDSILFSVLLPHFLHSV